MTFEEFEIGQNFWMYGSEFRCVDKGRYYVLAIKITEVIRRDPSWLNGPPFGVCALPLDAHDIEICFRTKEEEAEASQSED